MFYTFQDSKLPIEEHYSKKGVHPVEVYDILPDDEMWKYPCAQVCIIQLILSLLELPSKSKQTHMKKQGRCSCSVWVAHYHFISHYCSSITLILISQLIMIYCIIENHLFATGHFRL